MATNEKTHNVEFAKGGKTHMFPQQSSDPAEAGETRDTTAKDNLKNGGAVGGKTKMFGFTSALPAQGGITSAR
jgi:hypothetical protein